jgi:hypothetical protein
MRAQECRRPALEDGPDLGMASKPLVADSLAGQVAAVLR